MTHLPATYAITAAGLFADLDRFLDRLEAALADGLRLLQVRDRQLPAAARAGFVTACIDLCRPHGCRVLVNGDADLARTAGADGVHVPSADLARHGRGSLPGLVGASCHDAGQLAQASAGLGADFVVLSPVLRTLTHVDAKPLGWAGFARLARDCTCPVYALGGLTDADLPTARSHGAVGLASMRAVWGLDPRPAEPRP